MPQGVPRNMILRDDLKTVLQICGIHSSKKFPAFQNCVLPFLCFQNNQGNKEFRSDLDILVLLIQSKSE